MKTLLKITLAVGIATALSGYAKAQTVAVKALGSSGVFLELGLGASSPTHGTINAICAWSENSSSVVATDTSTGSSLTDTGNAWVAWTPGTGTCAAPGSNSQIYSYLQTDSVVGNRCLFNGSKCTIAYPTSNPAPADLLYTGGTCGSTTSQGECNLPAAVATALNNTAVNAAGTDIRPEDAEFAIARAVNTGSLPCGTAVVSGSQYLALGYTNGSAIDSAFSTSSFHVINFSLPSTGFFVTNVGATPVVVVANKTNATDGLGQSGITNLSNSVLAKFLDGTDSFANQAQSTNPTNTGAPVTAIIREPLSGTYNTMEYNIPNATGNTIGDHVSVGITPASANKTSQDVGLNQLAAQKACNANGTPINPLNIGTTSGGFRKRAIGTGESLKETNLTTDSLGYGFWSVANFASVPNTKYLKVDGIDPLLKSSATYTGVVPTLNSAELANVDLHNVANGSYPIYSLLRLVNAGTTALPAVTNLASAAQAFVNFGTTTSRPDFITPSQLTVVRSHFIPPIGANEPTTPANGDSKLGNGRTACTAAESGGDVGGVVLTLAADSSTYCVSGNTTGLNKQRR
jgi:hypothetical protein